jgi:Tol biopolymer transport system component/DNA-binding winged helix-turn-helix (wHTH) protein
VTAEEQRTPFRAGDWIINPEANLLSRDDIERHVEPKVMKVLLTLALRQGHVYTKEELIAAVWPDTFVSDDALTRCISILRRATDDDAHEPRFIQTVPKVGYRLVATLTPITEPVIESPKAAEKGGRPRPLSPGPEIVPSPESTGRQSSRKNIFNWLLWVGVAVLLLVCLGGGLWLWQSRHAPAASLLLETTAFTGDAGEQTQPQFSPDGRTIAFVRTNPAGGPRRIFLKQIGSETSKILILNKDDQVEQYNPVWSPDGTQIAYLGRSEAGLGIYLAPATPGATAKRIFIPQEASNWERGALSWSPDGRYLAFPDHMGDAASSSIYQLELGSLRAQSVTSPPPGAEGDLAPAYSPDGRLLAFTRASETAVRDIFWKSLDDGSIHQLTHDRKNIDSFTWDRDSSHIIFSSNRAGKFALWRVGLRDAEPARMPIGTEDATQPATGPLPGQLVYTQGSAIWGIDRVPFGSDAQAPQDTIVSSTQEDSAPTLSPDDALFAFQSRRSGNQEIWTATASGEHLHQVTSANGPVTGSPSWSHHDDQILYDSRPEGHSHIFVIAASGGKARQLTFGNVNDIIPRWSIDDRTVYFRSNRGGRWQLWKVSIDGGTPEPITKGDGMVPQESPDGKWLYFTRGDEAGLWRVLVGGGDEVRVLSVPAAGYWGYWHVTRSGIFYLDTTSSPAAIRIFDPAAGRSRPFADLHLTPPPFQGLTVFSDGRSVLLTREREIGRHITLVQRRGPE